MKKRSLRRDKKACTEFNFPCVAFFLCNTHLKIESECDEAREKVESAEQHEKRKKTTSKL